MHREDQFIPHLIVSNGLAALDFYKEAFGADQGHTMMTPEGKKLLHGELTLDRLLDSGRLSTAATENTESMMGQSICV